MVVVSPDVSDRERVLVRTRAHTAVLATAFLPATLAVALLALAVRAFPGAEASTTPGTLALSGAAGLAAVTVARLALRVWEWDRTLLAVTDQQILVVKSAVRRETRSVPLRSVERLAVTQGLAGRLLGYGSIVVENSGRRSRLAYVPHPERVSALIAAHAGPPDAREQAARTSGLGPPRRSPDDVVTPGGRLGTGARPRSTTSRSDVAEGL